MLETCAYFPNTQVVALVVGNYYVSGYYDRTDLGNSKLEEFFDILEQKPE